MLTKTIFEVDEIANAGIPAEDLATTLGVLQRMRKNLKTALNNR